LIGSPAIKRGMTTLQLTNDADEALLQLLRMLDTAGYHFVTVTPATHARIVGRADKAEARDLRDIFGWSLPFAPDVLPREMLHLLEQAGALAPDGTRLKSAVRVGRIHGKLILHSAYPPSDEDSVFFSPDTYRFAEFIRAELPRVSGVQRLVDIGAGPGTGAIMAAALLPGARLTLADINPLALRLAAINARHAGIEVELVDGGIEAVRGPFDAAIANPPFMVDEEERTYRNGGDMHGGRLSLDWAIEALERLTPGGRLLLYTGAAIVGGRDELKEALEAAARAGGHAIRYREIDPDIYGEEMDEPAYRQVERIAAVGAVLEKGPSR
jgi:methylase of polypeptide subunit release factors